MPVSSHVVWARYCACSSRRRSRSRSSAASADSSFLAAAILSLISFFAWACLTRWASSLVQLAPAVLGVEAQLGLGAGHLAEEVRGGLRPGLEPSRGVEEELRVVGEDELRAFREPAVAVLGAGGGTRLRLEVLDLLAALDDHPGEPDDLGGLLLGLLLGEVVRVGGDGGLPVQAVYLLAYFLQVLLRRGRGQRRGGGLEGQGR